MLLLSKEKVTEYLKEKMPQLDFSRPLLIREVGEGSRESDGDGFLNYIFRVSDGKTKLILKQGREHGRVGTTRDLILPMDRSFLEYQSMNLRKAITPEYVPDTYFYDKENLILAAEDVAHLKIMRFQMNKGVVFPLFARQIGEFLAKIHFYTSEYYLETKPFRELTSHFMNHMMRDVFDTGTFITSNGTVHGMGKAISDEYMTFAKELILDPRIVKERYKMRELYVKKGEAMIHADAHTSNILLDEDEMKVIDMEYTFCGPMSYDLGYLACHILSQYVCTVFRKDADPNKWKQYEKYCLNLLAEIFEEYCHVFFQCWDEDVKNIYQGVQGFKEDLAQRLLSEMIGFCATNNIARCSEAIMMPEYAELPPEDRAKAVFLSMLIDRESLLRLDKFRTVREWTAMIDEIRRITFS